MVLSQIAEAQQTTRATNVGSSQISVGSGARIQASKDVSPTADLIKDIFGLTQNIMKEGVAASTLAAKEVMQDKKAKLDFLIASEKTRLESLKNTDGTPRSPTFEELSGSYEVVKDFVNTEISETSFGTDNIDANDEVTPLQAYYGESLAAYNSSFIKNGTEILKKDKISQVENQVLTRDVTKISAKDISDWKWSISRLGSDSDGDIVYKFTADKIIGALTSIHNDNNVAFAKSSILYNTVNTVGNDVIGINVETGEIQKKLESFPDDQYNRIINAINGITTRANKNSKAIGNKIVEVSTSKLDSDDLKTISTELSVGVDERIKEKEALGAYKDKHPSVKEKDIITLNTARERAERDIKDAYSLVTGKDIDIINRKISKRAESIANNQITNMLNSSESGTFSQGINATVSYINNANSLPSVITNIVNGLKDANKLNGSYAKLNTILSYDTNAGRQILAHIDNDSKAIYHTYKVISENNLLQDMSNLSGNMNEKIIGLMEDVSKNSQQKANAVLKRLGFEQSDLFKRNSDIAELTTVVNLSQEMNLDDSASKKIIDDFLESKKIESSIFGSKLNIIADKKVDVNAINNFVDSIHLMKENFPDDYASSYKGTGFDLIESADSVKVEWDSGSKSYIFTDEDGLNVYLSVNKKTINALNTRATIKMFKKIEQEPTLKESFDSAVNSIKDIGNEIKNQLVVISDNYTENEIRETRIEQNLIGITALFKGKADTRLLGKISYINSHPEQFPYSARVAARSLYQGLGDLGAEGKNEKEAQELIVESLYDLGETDMARNMAFKYGLANWKGM